MVRKIERRKCLIVAIVEWIELAVGTGDCAGCGSKIERLGPSPGNTELEAAAGTTQACAAAEPALSFERQGVIAGVRA